MRTAAGAAHGGISRLQYLGIVFDGHDKISGFTVPVPIMNVKSWCTSVFAGHRETFCGGEMST